MKKSEQKGFSMLELVVIIMIMVVLGGIMVPMYLVGKEKARIAAADYEIKVFADAMKMHYILYNYFPIDYDGFASAGGIPDKISNENEIIKPFVFALQPVPAAEELRRKGLLPAGRTMLETERQWADPWGRPGGANKVNGGSSHSGFYGRAIGLDESDPSRWGYIETNPWTGEEVDEVMVAIGYNAGADGIGPKEGREIILFHRKKK